MMLNGAYRAHYPHIQPQPVTGVESLFERLDRLENFETSFSILTSRTSDPRYYVGSHASRFSENRFEVELLASELLPKVDFDWIGLVGNDVYADQVSFSKKGKAFVLRGGDVFLDDNPVYVAQVHRSCRKVGKKVVLVLVGEQSEAGHKLVKGHPNILHLPVLSDEQGHQALEDLIEETFATAA